MTRFLIFLFSFSNLLLQAQDHVFLNSYQSLIRLNPSFAGSNGLIRNQTSYRNQNPLLSGRTESMLNSFDAFIKPVNGGIAFTLQRDDFSYGTLQQTSIGLAYAQYLSFREGDLKIIPSIQASYVNKFLDLNALHFGDPLYGNGGTIQWQPGTIPEPRKSYFSFGSGLLINYKNKLYFGSYIFNANQPSDGFLGDTKLPYRILLHASYMKELNANSFLQLSGRYSQQGEYSFSQLSANIVFMKHVMAGVGYVFSNNVGYVFSNKVPMLNAGYRGDLFSVLVSYDLTMNELSRSTAGSFELHLAFSLRPKENRHPSSMIGFENW